MPVFTSALRYNGLIYALAPEETKDGYYLFEFKKGLRVKMHFNTELNSIMELGRDDSGNSGIYLSGADGLDKDFMTLASLQHIGMN